MNNIFRLLTLSFFVFSTPTAAVFAQVTPDDVTLSTTTAVESTEVGQATLYFFHSPTCPHCRAEQVFLDTLEEKYPTLTILRYEATDPEHVGLMRELARTHGAERVLGNIPLTFIGDKYVVGYDADHTTGRVIENAVRVALGLEELDVQDEDNQSFNVPFFGTISQERFSLPIMAILLGFLDGFNVCSLGALVLIIGLSLKLQRRKAIVLFGGTFIVTTALVYGALIVAWYHVFELFSAYLDFMKILVALIALGGGAYFMKEYLRMRRQGAQCEFQESKLINRFMERTGKAFEDNTKFIGILGAVFLFAAVVAVVEFPCSAAVPVVFAGILSNAGLSTLSYLGHIGLFILFYLLDEIVVFGIAAYRLKIWMTSGAFTKAAVLAEALILLAIGVFYFGATIGLL